MFLVQGCWIQGHHNQELACMAVVFWLLSLPRMWACGALVAVCHFSWEINCARFNPMGVTGPGCCLNCLTDQPLRSELV